MIRLILDYIIKGLAVVGLIAIIAFFGYTSGSKTTKVSRSDRCINSACDPGQKCSARFVRHMGECK